MLSKTDIKRIKALHRSKERERQGLFLCEGHKLVGDMLGAYPCHLLVLSPLSAEAFKDLLEQLAPESRPQRVEVVEANFDFRSISTQSNPQPVLALFALPQQRQTAIPKQGLSLLLDAVQDPGNVGTILRTADWFGITKVYLGSGCAEPYAPKVLQATMGALSRVQVEQVKDAAAFAKAFEGEVLGAFLEGESLYDLSPLNPERPTLLVVGNEGQGISPQVAQAINRRITIPAHKPESKGSESLNVAIATAICLSELRKVYTT